MSLREEVEAALDSANGSSLDRATATLAVHYAELIDDAAPAAKYAAALEWLAGVDVAPEDAKHVRAITTALARHSVASDLGPKLLATLDALGLTPKARSAVKKGVSDDKPAANPLDELANARARKGRAESLDASAT